MKIKPGYENPPTCYEDLHPRGKRAVDRHLKFLKKTKGEYVMLNPVCKDGSINLLYYIATCGGVPDDILTKCRHMAWQV